MRLKILAVILLLLTFVGVIPGQDTTLIASYPFDGNLNDGSGNGKDATETGGITYGTDRFGNSSSAIQFDGIDDFVVCSDLGFSDVKTVSLWFKGDFSVSSQSTTDVSNRMSVFSGWVSGSDHVPNSDYDEVTLGSTSRDYSGSSGNWLHRFFTASGILYHSDIWYHVVIHFEDEETYNVWINGQYTANFGAGTFQNLAPWNGFLTLGRYDFNGDNPYTNGMLDDIKVYNRVLAQSEVDSLYHINSWNGGNILTFQVDMSIAIRKMYFLIEMDDSLVIRGNFNGWAGNEYLLFDFDGDNIWSGTYDVGYPDGDSILYKFVIDFVQGENPGIWENLDFNNRVIHLNGNPQILSSVYFSDDSLLEAANYPFSGDANDISGNQRDGAVSGALPNADRFGINDRSYLFDGSDDLIIFPPSSSYLASRGWSVSAFFRVNHLNNNFQAVFTEFNSDLTNHIDKTRAIDFNIESENRFSMAISRSTGVGDNDYLEYRAYSSSVIEEGKWYHFVGIVNLIERKMSLYIDNVFENEISIDGYYYNYLDWLSPLYAGVRNISDQGGLVNYFNGLIDDIHIYDWPISVDDIDSLFHIGAWPLTLPILTVNSFPFEVSGDFDVTYNISYFDSNAVSLLIQYSTDCGVTWNLASIFGDTTTILPDRYFGNFTWYTSIDIPLTEKDSVLLKITPYDADLHKNGIAAISNYFTVDNNQTPTADLFEKPGEQKEDVLLYFQFSDAENDSLLAHCTYREMALDAWKDATISVASKIVPGTTDSLTWHSFSDIPEYTGYLWFRIEPRDHDPGTSDSIYLFINNLGAPEITLTSNLSGELSGDISISYQIEDDENDNVSILCQYSRDSLAWHLATVSGDTQNIAPANYSGEIIWQTVSNLPGIDDFSVWIRFVPYDAHQGFIALTPPLHIDNNARPSLVFGTSDARQGGLVRVPVEISDAESDTIGITYQYKDGPGDWSVWNAVNGQLFGPDNYEDTLYIPLYETLGFGIYPSVLLNLRPLDNDSGNIVQSPSIDVNSFAGDYSGDIHIDYEDLLLFAIAWWDKSLNMEIGPATGTPPLLIPNPDGKIDFEDLMVFAQQWNWSFDNPEFAKSKFLTALSSTDGPAEHFTLARVENSRAFSLVRKGELAPLPAAGSIAKEDKRSGSEVELIQSDFSPWEGSFGDELNLVYYGDESILGFSITIEADPRMMALNNAENILLKGLDGFVFSGIDEKNGRMLINAVVFESTEAVEGVSDLLVLKVQYLEEGFIPLKIQYKINGPGGLLLAEGYMENTIQGHLAIPEEFALHQNFPNPFNPSTTIRYELPVGGEVHMEIFNVLGQHVAKLISEKQNAGYHQQLWQIQNTGFQASGLYILRLDVKGEDGKRYTSHKKMLLIK